jgi:geranylgeranylglycerol-phosphate geranylgeranyltransferase
MRIKDAIEILRPINCLMGSLTIIIGLLNTRVGISSVQLINNLILGVITYFFLAGSGMVINDIYDIEIDKINRPQRPIPRGSISLEQAKSLFILYLLVGIAVSILNSVLFSLGFLNVLIAVFFGLMGWIYAKWGKRSGFLGNIIVSISFSIGMIYGAILNNSTIPNYIYFFFLTSFSLLLSREIIKGCEDIQGDKIEGVRTLAIKLGTKKSTFFSMLFSGIAVLFFVLPIITAIINPVLFLIFMIIGLIDVLYAIIIMLKKTLEQKDYKKISLLLKIGAFLGLLAFIFASL